MSTKKIYLYSTALKDKLIWSDHLISSFLRHSFYVRVKMAHCWKWNLRNEISIKFLAYICINNTVNACCWMLYFVAIWLTFWFIFVRSPDYLLFPLWNNVNSGKPLISISRCFFCLFGVFGVLCFIDVVTLHIKHIIIYNIFLSHGFCVT